MTVRIIGVEVKSVTRGTVKRWLGLRGYGFIDVDGRDKDIFVHTSDVKGRYGLSEGERVEFEIIETYKGPKAINVKPVSR